MARYQISFSVEGKNINSIRSQVEKAFGADAAAQVRKEPTINSRADRLGDAEGTMQDAAQLVEELRDEMQEWYDSIPENLQNGDKANEVQETIDALESLHDEIEGVDFGSVSFPGMF